MGYLDQSSYTYLFKYCPATGMQNDVRVCRASFWPVDVLLPNIQCGSCILSADDENHEYSKSVADFLCLKPQFL